MERKLCFTFLDKLCNDETIKRFVLIYMTAVALARQKKMECQEKQVRIKLKWKQHCIRSNIPNRWLYLRYLFWNTFSVCITCNSNFLSRLLFQALIVWSNLEESFISKLLTPESIENKSTLNFGAGPSFFLSGFL